MIAISNQATSRTPMYSHRESLANFCPTQTGLRRSARVNFHKHTPSFFRFVREHKQKVRPSGIVNGLRQRPCGQSFDIQILNGNQSVVVHNFARFFMMKISTLIADVVMEPLEQENCFAAAVRTFPSSRYAALQSSQLGLCCSVLPRVIDRAAVAQRREASKAYIDTHHVRIKGQGSILVLNGERSKPTIRFSFDCKGLNLTLNWSMQFDANLPDFRQPQLVPVDRPADLSKCQTVVAVGGAETGKPRTILCLRPAKEILKRKVNSLQAVLQDTNTDSRHVLALLLNSHQLQVLIKPRNGFALQFPRFFSLLQGCIVKLRTDAKLIVKRLLLALCGIYAIAKNLEHGGLILPFRFPTGLTILKEVADAK